MKSAEIRLDQGQEFIGGLSGHYDPHELSVNQIVNLRKFIWKKPWENETEMQKILRTEQKPLVEEIGRSPLPTEFGDWTYLVFGDYTNGSHHEMLVFGNIVENALGNGEDILVRIHSSCRTSEVYGAINCECKDEFREAMNQVRDEGSGIIMYLEQEGRGTGVSGKMAQLNGMFEWRNGKISQKIDPKTGERVDTDKAYKKAGYPSEVRDFTIAGDMLHHIGVKSVRLLTNNPRKIKGIESAGIRVTPVSIHIEPANEIIASDLRSKAVNLGHVIPEDKFTMRKNDA